MSQETFSDLMKTYITKEFYEFKNCNVMFEGLQNALTKLILCDRYNKGEPVTQGLDFEVVRNTLQKFNTRNLLEFFGEKEYAFLYMFYYEKAGLKDAIAQKDVDSDKLIDEMQALYDEALKYVPKGDPFFYT